ncbi:MAG: BrxA/BrxB family bacilliredoxin [Bacilli bacterium]
MEFNFFIQDVVDTAREELSASGYTHLRTPEAVDEAFARPGTQLVMINSVCGCAGGIARPAARYALDFDYRPDHLVTVFAGQDPDATARAREYFEGFPPSSPSFALVKDGKCVGMVLRQQIEGHEPIAVVEQLQQLFEQHCEQI